MTAALDCSTDDAMQQRLTRLLATRRLEPDLLDACRDLRTLGIAVLVEAAAGHTTWDATSEPAFTACESEVLTGGGPAMAALESGALVSVADVAESSRPEWLLWSRIAGQLGWRSAVAVPVCWDGGSGAVVVYSVDPMGLSALLPKGSALGDAGESR